MNLQLGNGKKIEVVKGHFSPKMALCAKKGLKIPQNGLKIECWAESADMGFLASRQDKIKTAKYLTFSRQDNIIDS